MAVASIVILKIITQVLSLEAYGMYSTIFEFLAFFGIAADLGLFTIAVREMGKGHRDKKMVIGNIFLMRMLLAAFTMGLATLSAFLIPAFQGTVIPLGVAIASLSVFFVILHGTVSSVLQVELKMQYSTIGIVGGKLISLGWMLAVIFHFYAGNPGDPAFYQLIFAGLIGNIFAFLYTLYYALRFSEIWPCFDRDYWKEVLVTAVPYGLALVLNMIYFRIDTLMIFFMRGPAEVALYSPVVRILEILSVVPVYFMNSVLPVLSRHIEEGSKKVGRMLTLSFDFLFILVTPMVTGLFLLAYPLVFIVTQPEFLSRLDEGFYGSDIAMQVLVFAMFFGFLNSVFNYSLVAVNKQSHLLWINGSAALLNIAANAALIPVLGFRGAALTSIFTEALILALSFSVARKYLPFKFDFSVIWKVILSTAVMGLTVQLLKDPTYNFMGLENLNVILLSGLGAIVYGVLLLALGAIPKEFLDKLRRA